MDDTELLHETRVLSHLLHHRYSPNASQNRILRLLRDEGDKTQKELSDRLEIRAASISEVVTKLEKAGYIQRARSESDRRNCLIRITPDGMENARAHDRERRELAARLFRSLDEKEKRELSELLGKLREDWEKEN